MMMLSKMIATTTTITDIREDINNVLKEWHFGTEDMFDNEDLECMADDIMKIINKKYQLPLKKQKQSRNKLTTK
jgi:isocitrate/isopropylmalate dehydrogenase